MKNSILALLVCIAACGGTKTNGGDMAGSHDLGGCAPQSCGGSEVCCVTNYFTGTASSTCAASCSSPAISVRCNGPSGCGGNPCCITTKAGYATDVFCGASATDCDPVFGGGMGKTHTCDTDADCAASTNFPNCCHAPGGLQPHFCFNANLVALAPGTVVCP